MLFDLRDDGSRADCHFRFVHYLGLGDLQCVQGSQARAGALVTTVLPIILTGLSPQAYEHPDDAAALNALRHTGGVETLVRKVNAWGFERLLRIQTTGSYLRVTPDNFPKLWSIFAAARDRLSLPITPEFYIKNEEDTNAFTAGVQKPIIVVNSGAVDHLEDDELLFVIAHEMGHIKSGHVLYYQIASYIPVLGGVFGDLTLGLGNLLSMGLQATLLHWQRTSELTADRAGLLACQDAETAFRALMKMAGLPHKCSHQVNVEDFLAQAREFENLDVTTIDKVAKFLSISGSNHPWTVMRAKELLGWIDSGAYDSLLKAPRLPPSAGAESVRRFCDQCGTKAENNGAYCSKCGHHLLTLQPD